MDLLLSRDDSGGGLRKKGVCHVSLTKGMTTVFRVCSTTRHRVLLGIRKKHHHHCHTTLSFMSSLSVFPCVHACVCVRIREGVKRTRRYSAERLWAERQLFKDDRCLLRTNRSAVLWKEADLFPPSVCLTRMYQSRDTRGARTALRF